MRQIPAFLYDAFAERLFGGNIAGVVFAEDLAAGEMQKLATELAAPTTGFVARNERGWRLRFFTPSQEIDMCGHVVVGVFCALQDEGLLGSDTCAPVQVLTKAGPIEISMHPSAEGTFVEMQQRPPAFREAGLAAPDLARLLGVEVHVLRADLPFAIVSTGLSHLFLGLKEPAALKALAPDFEGLAALSRTLAVDTIGVFALAPGGDAVDVRLRDLCPAIGNAEESASGTTNGALACFLAAEGMFASRPGEPVRVIAQQGVEMGRPSIIESHVWLDGAGVPSRVKVRGRAVRSLSGALYLP